MRAVWFIIRRVVFCAAMIGYLFGCLPTPAVIYWEVCIAFGPKPEIKTIDKDGRVIEQQDVDSTEMATVIMHACQR